MSFSIDAHITIAGGIMIWPFSRGTGYTITFNGGLLIEKKGRLQIEPYSTNIVVYVRIGSRSCACIQPLLLLLHNWPTSVYLRCLTLPATPSPLLPTAYPPHPSRVAQIRRSDSQGRVYAAVPHDRHGRTTNQFRSAGRARYLP
jgi:hypothetical protein